jgi:integrase
MAKEILKLDDVKRARVSQGEDWLCDGGGLYLRVRPNDDRDWFLRVKGRKYGLGAWPEVSLDDARKQASKRREQLEQGLDIKAPIVKEAEKIAPEGLTFKQAAEQYKDASDDNRGNLAYRKQWLAQLERHIFPHLGHLAVTSITPKMVIACLGPISHVSLGAGRDRCGGPFTARLLQGRIAEIFDWCIALEVRDDNPARFSVIGKALPHLKNPKSGKHFEALKQENVKPFIAALRADPCASARACEFLILTATRTSQVRFLTWDEIDIEKRLWVCPPSRTKEGKKKKNKNPQPHDIPLSERAIEILIAQGAKEKQGSKELVFTHPHKSSAWGADSILRACRRANEASVKQNPRPTDHGMRSTFRDWCGSTGVERELAEHALDHAFGSAAERDYARDKLIERRRPVMDAWAEFCSQPPAEVINIERRRPGIAA